MGQFGEDFGAANLNTIMGMFMDQPPRTLQTDPRTGYQRGMEARNVGMSDAIARQYSASMADPNYALPDVPHQRMTEQELIDSVYNRLGAAGAGGSGTARSLAGKALVDYRLGLLDKQTAARQKLRSDMIQAMQGYPGTPYTVTPVEGKEAGITSMAKSYVAGGMPGMSV